MKNEEVGYSGSEKPALTVFPDSIVMTNKRIICQPKIWSFYGFYRLYLGSN
jgi:hypothetical protein